MTVEDTVGLFSSCLPGWHARRVIEVAVRCGLRWWSGARGPGQALEPGQDGSAIRELCSAAGLSVSGLSVQDPAVSLGTPRAALRYLGLAGAVGARFVRLFAPTYRGGGSLAREERSARAGLDTVIDAAAAEGVAVLIETSPATLAPSPERAVGLIEHHASEHAGVLFDPGNTVIEGYLAPALAVARLGPYLQHVHVKNIAWRRVSGAWAWRYASLPAGIVAWAEVLDDLARAGYRGGFSIDHLSGRPTPGRLQAETEHLRALVTAHGQVNPRKELDSSPASV